MESLNQADGLKMNQESFHLMRDFIYARSGIFFADNKQAQLESRLSLRLKANNLSDYDQYYDMLKYDDPAGNELHNLFDSVSTNETSFFRSPPQIEAFQNKVLGELIERQAATKSLRLWSAGCSTGEEPYTMAMVVHEVLGEAFADWDIRILGSDLSPKALRSAAAASYNDYALRGVSAAMKDRYFVEEAGTYRIADFIKRTVTFEQFNLSDPAAAGHLSDFDVIFCRNVLIYFDEELKRTVVSRLYESLKTGGHLFIGHSESLHNISRAFKLVHFPGALGYRKE